MAHNFLRADHDQPFLLPRTCATGCPRVTSRGIALAGLGAALAAIVLGGRPAR